MPRTDRRATAAAGKIPCAWPRMAWAVAGVLLLPGGAFAGTDTWTAGTGNWNTSSNWNGGAGPVPAPGDTVNIVNSDGTARTITYNYTGAALSLASLTLDLTGAGTTFDTLSMAGNMLSDSGAEVVGLNGRGAISQSGGTNDAGTLDLALDAGSTGSYSLSSGTLTVLSAGGAGANNAYIGGGAVSSGGAGTLTISGGSMNVAGTVKVWDASSMINLSGGTLTASSLDIGSTPALLHWTTAGTLDLTGSGSYVPTTVPSGGTLFLGATTGNTTVTGPAAGLTNSGTVILDSPGGAFNTTFAGNLTNNSGDAIRVLGGAGGSRVINGTLDNFGAISFFANVPFSNATGDGTPLIANAIKMEANSQLFPSIGPAGQSSTLIATSNGGLTIAGAVSVSLTKARDVSPSGYTAGTYILFHYNGALNGSVSNLSVSSGQAGYTYSFINDAANGNIDLEIVPSTQNAWTGSTDSNWNDSNWGGGAAPSTAQCATFPSPVPAGRSTITLANGETTNGLKFNDNYTLTGGSVLLNNAYVDVAAGKSVTIASSINSTFGLQKSGLGTLTISGANSYTRATVANSGTLIAGAANTFPSGGTIQTMGGTLDTGSLNQSVATVIVSSGNLNINGGTVNVSNGVMTDTVAGAAPASLNLHGGTLITPSFQNGANSSALNWTGGTLQLTGTGSVPTTTIPVGATLSLMPTASNVIVTGQSLGTSGPAKPAVLSIPSPNFNSDRSGAAIDAIVIHTTEESYASTIAEFQDPASQDSANYVNNTDGTITEMVDPAKGYSAYHATYYNDRAIGIENVGFSDQASTWNSQNVPALEALVAYLAYTYKVPVLRPTDNSQYNVAPNPTFAVDPTFNEPGIVAHGQVQPWDRYDPGQYFPWTTFIADVQTLIANSIAPAPLTNNGTINVTNSGGYAVTYRGDITSFGAMNVNSTGLTLNGNLKNTSATLTGGSLTVNGNESLGFTGNATSAAFTQNSGTHTVSGTLTLASGAGPSATYTLQSGSITAANTTINSNGSFLFNGGSASLGNLSLTGGGQLLMSSGRNKNLVLTSLSMTGASKLDLSDNSLTINYTGNSPAATIRSYLASGFNQGAWNGVGLSSTAAHSDSFGTSLTALGYNDTGTSVIVKYTYYGDNNLDGSVTAADFQDFLSGLTSGGSTWQQGDYTYDGVVDLGNDFNLFLRSYLTQGGALGDLAPLILNDAALSASQRAQLLAAVPEPSSLALLVIAPAILARRRRK